MRVGTSLPYNNASLFGLYSAITDVYVNHVYSNIIQIKQVSWYMIVDL